MDGADDMAAMSSRPRRPGACAAVFALILALPSQLCAQGLAVFEGRWQGSTIEADAEPGVAAGAFELEIRQLRDGAFAARWTNPSLPDDSPVGRQIDARLAPTGRPGVFAVQPEEPSLIERVFARPVTGNPLDGETLLWGRLIDGALILYSLSIGDDGHPALIRTAYRPQDEELAFERSTRLGVAEPLVIRGQLTRQGG